jgi:DNA mismatch repair protein MSH2
MTYVGLAESTAALVADLDVLISFATTAALAPAEYTRPKLIPTATGDSGVGRRLILEGARHPCVELMDDVDFIPNNYSLQYGTSQFQIITGPNMGGKSTYIRAAGAIAVMAHVGSFVPCSRAEMTIIDCVLVRVGAGDAVQKGVSTFMAEMLEASVILSTATPSSLIIIDELGRGTSTFDGFGIAWSISSYIIKHLSCLCVFATHFHELTAIEKQHRCVKNRHVTAHTDPESGHVVMLYDVRDGPCLESFGIHVAAMAGFPLDVINEAKRKISDLENQVGAGAGAGAGSGIGAEEQEEKNSKRSRINSTMVKFADTNVLHLAPEDLKAYMRASFTQQQQPGTQGVGVM